MVSVSALQRGIEHLWEGAPGAALSPDDSAATEVIRRVIDLLDMGVTRMAEIRDGHVVVYEWLIQPIPRTTYRRQPISQPRRRLATRPRLGSHDDEQRSMTTR